MTPQRSPAHRRRRCGSRCSGAGVRRVKPTQRRRAAGPTGLTAGAGVTSGLGARLLVALGSSWPRPPDCEHHAHGPERTSPATDATAGVGDLDRLRDRRRDRLRPRPPDGLDPARRHPVAVGGGRLPGRVAVARRATATGRPSRSASCPSSRPSRPAAATPPASRRTRPSPSPADRTSRRRRSPRASSSPRRRPSRSSPRPTAGRRPLTPDRALAAGRTYRVALRTAAAVPAGSWAFHVRGPVTVVSTIPGDATTAVPVQTGVEVTFDQDDVARDGRPLQDLARRRRAGSNDTAGPRSSSRTGSPRRRSTR